MTYSILAVDEKTGDLGVAVHSHYFSVGQQVPFIKSGVGAVARQFLSEMFHGEEGLKLLSESKTPDEVLQTLLEKSASQDVCQTAVIDCSGKAAAYTGKQCLAYSSHLIGTNFSVQAALMEKNTVVQAMATSFQSSKKPLPERLLDVLDAAQGEGGDLRGLKSASLIVVKGQSSGSYVNDRIAELHIYDHENPLGELRRLLTAHRAYEHASCAEMAMVQGELSKALEEYEKAMLLLPDELEIKFWQALAMLRTGSFEVALSGLAEVFAVNPNWKELALRLADSGLIPMTREQVSQMFASAFGKQ